MSGSDCFMNGMNFFHSKNTNRKKIPLKCIFSMHCHQLKLLSGTFFFFMVFFNNGDIQHQIVILLNISADIQQRDIPLRDIQLRDIQLRDIQLRDILLREIRRRYSAADAV